MWTEKANDEKRSNIKTISKPKTTKQQRARQKCVLLVLPSTIRVGVKKQANEYERENARVVQKKKKERERMRVHKLYVEP